MMYSNFKPAIVPLKEIFLDYNNPRIVTPKKLSTQQDIISYLFEFEDLEKFITKIATEGKNAGAEKPYVVKEGQNYTVVEGNTRIAAYKILTGIEKTPSGHKIQIPSLSVQQKKSLSDVDCTVAPSRDSLLPIMASAHFGRGDKSKWGWLGSRKAIFEEWGSKKSVKEIAKAFNLTQGNVRDLILEYQLYLKAVGLAWTKAEKI